MDKNIFSYFENHPGTEVFYFTTDGYAFFHENDAINHAASLHDNTVMTISRINMEEEKAWQQLEEDELRAEKDELERRQRQERFGLLDGE